MSEEEGRAERGGQAQDALAECLAVARTGVAPPAMPKVNSLRLRLGTSPAARAMLPNAAMVRRSRMLAETEWRENEAVREDAIAQMSIVVGDTELAERIEELARMCVIERKVHDTLFWQPWRPRMDEASREQLRAAMAARRGVLLSACHLGQFFMLSCAAGAIGVVTHHLGGRWLFETPSPDRWGRRQAHWSRSLHRHGVRLSPAHGSFAVACALLREGEAVFNLFDVPGPHQTAFLGRPTMMLPGTARLACAADALVVPLRARRQGHLVWVDAGQPFDPGDFESLEQLHGELAAAHTRWILDAPWSLEDPRRPGSWEDGAAAAAWTLPAKAPQGSAGDREQ
jgi:lauroyl/myristoyl acyltransferase